MYWTQDLPALPASVCKGMHAAVPEQQRPPNSVVQQHAAYFTSFTLRAAVNQALLADMDSKDPELEKSLYGAAGNHMFNVVLCTASIHLTRHETHVSHNAHSLRFTVVKAGKANIASTSQSKHQLGHLDRSSRHECGNTQGHHCLLGCPTIACWLSRAAPVEGMRQLG
eukprot:1826068-Amphidinium_carterae.2